MPEQRAAELCLLVSHEQVENHFWKALRLFVGRGKRFSADEVATGAGVHRRTLDCYRGYPVGHVDHRPLDLGQKFSIASFVGPDLTTAWLQPIGQVAYAIPDVMLDPGELAAETAEDSFKVVRMAVDGDLSNDNPDDIRSTGTRMMGHGAALVGIADRAGAR